MLEKKKYKYLYVSATLKQEQLDYLHKRKAITGISINDQLRMFIEADRRLNNDV